MHTGVIGQIRKTTVGRWLLFRINTGLFWIYGILTCALAFQVSGFWFESTTSRLLLSLPPALLAAFTLAHLVHALFWRRFHNVWMDSYVIGVLAVAILAVRYALDNHEGREDALSSLPAAALVALIMGWRSYVRNRKRAA
jgi:hypothetical protein